jgi:hypothetical protein
VNDRINLSAKGGEDGACSTSPSIERPRIQLMEDALRTIATMDVFTRPGEKPPQEVMRDLAKAALIGIPAGSPSGRRFYGAECPSYPACDGGCGLGCTKETERNATRKG